MKERTMDAIAEAENYFVAVIEQEAMGNVTPSRTEELHWAIEGLEGIACIKFKNFKKSVIMKDIEHSGENIATMSVRHSKHMSTMG